MEQIILQLKYCKVIQDQPGSYMVMSNNNICLLHVGSPSGAIKYAEWFNAKSRETKQ